MKKLTEFEIINRFFHRKIRNSARFPLGVGDDAALISAPPDHELATSVDTLVAGVHFDSHAKAGDLGYKSLAVSLSDLAAMGAQPAAVLLALTLPEADERWLQDFSRDFFQLADTFQVELIGGNITRGPLSISTVTFGWTPVGSALLRSGAQAGDEIYVTGQLGEAGLALRKPELGFFRPIPRIAAGLALRGLATAAIDISDGLAADLGKLLAASHTGGMILTERLPISANLGKFCTKAEAITLALTAGEDYELCFTAPAFAHLDIEQIFKKLNCPVHYLGSVDPSASGLQIFNDAGEPIDISVTGYQHF